MAFLVQGRVEYAPKHTELQRTYPGFWLRDFMSVAIMGIYSRENGVLIMVT